MKTKLCVKCGIEKPINEFESRYGGNGYRNACRKCLNGYRKERWRSNQKVKYEAHRIFQEKYPGQKKCIKCGEIKDLEKFNVHPTATDGRRNTCKRCQAIYSSNHHKKKKESLREHNLKKHGLTHDEYLQMLESQNGRCMICKSTKPSSSKFFKNFAVDHCHKTNKVRALLCHHCNTALGSFRDDVNLLRKAIVYLESFKP